MKGYGFRIFVVLGLLVLSVYYLYPTYADYQNGVNIDGQVARLKREILKRNPGISKDNLSSALLEKEDSIRMANPAMKEAREKRIKLGLDLQGGMYLALEVNTEKLLEKLAKDPDNLYLSLLKESSAQSKASDKDIVTILTGKLQDRHIRLSRYFGTIRDDDAKIIDKLKTQEKDAVTRAVEIIKNRVNQYGVSEPNIQAQGSSRIVVELPGVAKEEEAKKLLQGRALLEFKIVKDAETAIRVMKDIDAVAAGTFGKDSASAKQDPNKKLSKEEFEKAHPFFSIASVIPQSASADAYVRESDRAKVQQMLQSPEAKKVIPDNIEFLFSAKPEMNQDGKKIYKLYCVNKNAELTGGVIVDAQSNIDQQTSSPVVSMQMNSEGSREWARITGSNINKRCAIVLDGLIYSAPSIRSKIPSGNSQIDGMADMEEAKLLEIVLKAGALPAPIDIVQERVVGPSLGQDSIRQGLSSSMIGLLAVAIFMLGYYKKKGIVAVLGLVYILVVIMGILSVFHFTLTLPGIAGLVLTIVMAVDANVLIYERIYEELQTGKTVKAAVDAGFTNTYSAILDSNITTFLTGLILYQFGSGPVQGFALTLMIGIIGTLFMAMVVCRLMFHFLVAQGIKITD